MKHFTISIFFILFFFSVGNFAQNLPPIEVLGKVDSDGRHIRLPHPEDGNLINGFVHSKELERIIAKMKPGDEAIIRGYIAHHTVSNIETSMFYKPFFVIESITPISLKAIGNTEVAGVVELTNEFWQNQISDYSAYAIPVTAEVASAITFTAAGLLLNSYTTGANQHSIIQDGNASLLLFSGAVITGAFIYRQIKSAQKKR